MKKLLLIFLTFLTFNSFSQATLVKDINLGNNSSNPSKKIIFKNEVYFAADDGINGIELYKTDGTEAGTVLVKDIYTGAETGIKIFQAIATTEFLYFFAIEDSKQYLFKTDGSAAGTEKIKEFTSVSEMYDEINGKIIFSAENSLWASDGTEAGTLKIANFSVFGSDRFVKNGNEIYFSAESSSSIGKELYKTDGTSSGTVLVKDIRSGSADSFPNQFISVNNTVYFSANNGAQGTELWTTDGTEAGTVMVKDVNTGSGNTFSYNSKVIAYNNKIYFIYNSALWESDGTETGTISVKENLETVKTLFTLNNQILIIASNSSTREQIVWVSDGTEAGTTSFNPEYTEFSHNNEYAVVGNDLFFQGTLSPEGYELWKTDGTEAGTFLVKDIHPQGDDNNLESFISYNDKVIFTGNDGNWLGKELYISDGTEAGTFMIKDINKEGNRSSNAQNYFQFGNKILFSADNGINGRELWQLENGVASMLLDINPGPYYSNPSYFTEINGTVYFIAETKDTGKELWKTDGTASGTMLVKDINPDKASAFNNGNLAVANNKLYFFANDGVTGFELWESDGTETGTVLVKDINIGENDSYRAGEIIGYKNKVYFSAQAGDNDFEVWESDGTEAGTKIHHHYNFSGSSNPRLFTLFDDHLYYNSNGDLIRTDGTTALLVTQVEPSNLTVANDKLFFTAGFSDGGELWASTGGSSAYKVKEIRSGSSGSFPSKLTAHNNGIFFIANDGNTGNEIWFSDGTDSGTILVKDLREGGSSSSITEFVSFGDKVVFGGGENNSTTELWVSDGTTEGTKLFEEINPSTEQYNSGSRPSNFFVSNNTLYFSADNGTNGSELFVLEQNALTVKNENLSDLADVNIFPNPTKNILNFKVDNQQINEIKVYNLLGKEVMKLSSKESEIKSINISQLSKGMYIIQLKTDVKVFTKKILKQ